MRWRSRLTSSSAPARRSRRRRRRGEEEIEGQLRLAEPAGGVEARREAEAGGGGVIGVPGSSSATFISARMPGRRAPPSSRRPADTRMRFSSTSGTRSASVPRATRVEQVARLETFGGGCRRRAGACAAWRRCRRPHRRRRGP
jgi:hypothetical protein